SEDLTLRASAEAPPYHPRECNFALLVDSLEKPPPIPSYPNVKQTRSYSVFIEGFYCRTVMDTVTNLQPYHVVKSKYILQKLGTFRIKTTLLLIHSYKAMLNFTH
uniref:hypothetical protein n=1 Tax=Serratia marcescens TaxID=615 RepID=UPI00344F50BA